MNHVPFVAKLFCVLALGGSLFACGSSSEGGAGSTTVALVPGLQGMKEPFYKQMIIGAQAKAATLGVSLVLREPDSWDAAGIVQQIAFIDELIAMKVGGMVIVPQDTNAFIAPLKRAADAGIKIVTADQYIGTNTYGQGGPADFPIAYVGSDNYEGGKIACSMLADSVGSTGGIYIQNHKRGISATDAREQGCKDTIAAKVGMSIVAVDYNGDDAGVGSTQTTAALAMFPTLVGVFGCNVASGEAAGNAVAASDRAGSVKVVVFDAPATSVANLRNGHIQAMIAQKPALMGQLGVDIAVKAMNGQTGLPTKTNSGFVVIDASNVDSPEISQFLY
jgi:ribose transport system substrate-binding protein